MKRYIFIILISLFGLFLLNPDLHQSEPVKKPTAGRADIERALNLIHRHSLTYEDSLTPGSNLDTTSIELPPGERIFINTDTVYASILDRIGRNYYYADAHEAARICERLWDKSFYIYENVVGENNITMVDRLYRIGELNNCGKLNRPAKTAACVERALTITKMHHGPCSDEYAETLTKLGRIYFSLGFIFKARDSLESALALCDDPDLPPPRIRTYTLNRLARIYIMLNEPHKAKLCAEQAYAAVDTNWSYYNKTETYALSLKNLGTAYMAMGRYEEAENKYKQAVEILYGGRDEPLNYSEAGANYNNLGHVCRVMSHYPDAEKYFSKAIEVRKKRFGSDYPFLTYSYIGLAEMYMILGKYKEAEHYLEESLRITKKTYGPVHPHIAMAKNVLGALYQYRGNFHTASQYYHEALDMYQDLYGADNANVSNTKENLAILYAITGKSEISLRYFKQVLESRRELLDHVFSYSSEEQKRLYLSRYPLISDAFLTFALQSPSAETKDAALEMILKGKARIIEALMAEKKVSYGEYGSEARKTARQLSDIQESIAELYIPVYFGYLHRNFHDSLNNLRTIRDSLESQLSAECADFRESFERKHFDLNDIAEAIPEQTVLWEFCRYRPYDLNGKPDRNPESGGDKYLVFCLDHEGRTNLIDLGPVDVIDDLIDEYRDSIYASHTEVYSADIKKSQSSLDRIAGELYQHLFSPLPADSGIIISPDGSIGLLPFGVLRDSDNRYAIENYRISYLSSGRDLLQFEDKPILNGSALIMADPDYDLKVKKTTGQSPSSNTLFTTKNSINCLGKKFDRLYKGIKEATKIIKALEDKTGLKIISHIGAEATEGNIKNCDSSTQIIHVITHAFFCGDSKGDSTKPYIDQMPHSGMVFAGVNNIFDNSDSVTLSGCEDGILTEYEVSGLYLPNTELVTLSACETGLGEVSNSEGIYGLRRAFQHAGARAVLMSLWKVPDPETCDLMDYLYNAWFDGKTKAEALRWAKLKVIESCRANNGCAHPLFWGAFIIEGRAGK